MNLVVAHYKFINKKSLWIAKVEPQAAHLLVKLKSETSFFVSFRRLYRPPSAAGDEEPVADQVAREEQTSEEALPQTQAFLIQREAQVHQLTYGSQ